MMGGLYEIQSGHFCMFAESVKNMLIVLVFVPARRLTFTEKYIRSVTEMLKKYESIEVTLYMLVISEMKHLNEGECADIYEVDARTVLKLGKPG